MKILIATSSVIYNGGITAYNRELCSVLRDENEVHLLVNENVSSYEGYTKVRSTIGLLPYYAYSKAKALIEEINSENYDIIVNSNSHFIAIIAPFIHKRTRIITISHSLGTMDCDNAVYNYKYLNRVIVLSHSCKQYLQKRFKINSPDKLSILYNSVANYANADVIREQKKTVKRLSIVFAGGSAPSKSPEIVYQVVCNLCKTNLPFRFYWLGDSAPPLKKVQRYTNVSEIMPQDDRIVVTGRIPQSDATKIIAECNIFFAPSHREGFPMALLEAMRVGCIPIVTDYNVANKEIITDGVNGFVIPHNDIQAFVAKMTDIIINHSEYYTVYDKCFNTFRDELSFDIWRQGVKSLLNDHTEFDIVEREKLSKWKYVKSRNGCIILDKWNLIENHVKEILPCAYKFHKYYNKFHYRKP